MLNLGLVLAIGNKNGTTAQFMVIETHHKTLEDFKNHISDCDFVIVSEKYRRKGETGFNRTRQCVLNTHLIGRVSEYNESEE